MKYLFNIFSKLIEKLRLMIIKTLKTVLDSQLKHYYFEINFRIKDHKNRYKLPLIAQVIDEDEAIALQQNLIEAIKDKNFDLLRVIEPQLIHSTEDLKRRKESILSSQAISGHETIKIILQKAELEKGIVKVTYNAEDIKEFEINIAKKGDIPFESIKDLFVFKINKSILED